MTDTEELAFAACFLKLRGVFNLRGERGEVQALAQVYFKVLRRFPLTAVEAGAERWIERGTRFPKPAEWLAAIPRVMGLELSRMPQDDAQAYRRAVALKYQDEPCTCQQCVLAGVTHRYLRFVPDQDDQDRDIRVLMDGKAVVRGHWAHGEELARWYDARDRYLGLKRQHLPKSMPRARRRRAPRADAAAFVAQEIIASVQLNEALESALSVDAVVRTEGIVTSGPRASDTDRGTRTHTEEQFGGVQPNRGSR